MGKGRIVSLDIEIDHDVCTGSASCVSWEPKVFALGEGGLAVVLDPSAASEAQIITVAEACPTGAIIVRRDGQLIVG